MLPETSDRRTRAAAWASSLVVHSLLTASVVYLGLRGGTRAGGDEPTREIGVVLRESSQPPTPFESDSIVESDATEPIETPPAESPATEASLAPSPFSDLLNQLLEEPKPGAGPQTGGSQANPPQPPPAGGGRIKLPIGQTRVRFYGVEGVGSRFVFALDRSTSMQGGPLRSAKAELIESLKAIEESHRFNILFFNTRVSALDISGGQRRIAFGTEQNKRRAVGFIRSVTAEGGTQRKAALDHALRNRPDVIFFLTDDDSPMTRDQLAEILGDAIGAATIHTVEFGRGPDHGQRNFLIELAEATGGTRCYVDTTLLPR